MVTSIPISKKWLSARIPRTGCWSPRFAGKLRSTFDVRCSTFDVPGLVALLVVSLMLALFVDPALAAESAVARPVTHPTLKAASEAASADQSLVLLVFSATWCGPCKMLKSQTLESQDFLDRAGEVQVVDLDVDRETDAARTFGVSAIPALFLLTGDGKIVAHQVGFMSVLDLIGWIEKGRERVKAGEWEGTVPGTKFDEFVKKAAGDGLGTNDLERLVAMLGDADPGDRTTGAQLVLARREEAVPALIAAVGDTYLGTRISASDLLQQLAPDAPVPDPWQSPLELSNGVATLKKWWADTGSLPAARPVHADAATANEIKAMIEGVRSDKPAERTDSMAGLVRQGTPALLAIRDAIRKSERLGDQRSVSLFEDVRWAILVPDSLEEKTGVRNVLARGKSSERQEAATRLAKAGSAGLNALTELLGDSDPLVVESAIRAVSSIGGKDTVSALAVLLQNGDSNLRMTAAQALGHTQDPEAIKPLLSAFIDPNEVVACTALGALEEIHSRNNLGMRGQDFSSDVLAALRTSLADPRWRVRATAAQIIGKMRIVTLSDDVKKLLEDSDSFVAKSALTALSTLGGAPDVAVLVALGKRLPNLRGDTVQMMLQNQTEDTVKTINDIFNSGSVEDQLAILNAMAQKDEDSTDNEGVESGWKPLLTRATTATDPRLRRAAALVLSTKPIKLSSELVGPLLADNDPQTREAAAGVVLGILNGSTERRTRFGWTPTTATERTNKASATQLAAWHDAMAQHVDTNSGLNLAVAIFATGDGKTDLPIVEKALANAHIGAAESDKDAAIVKLLLSRLRWPDGKPLLDKLCASPVLYAMAAKESKGSVAEAADYLLEPSRFKAALEPLTGPELDAALEAVAGYNYGNNAGWSLWSEDDRTRALDLALTQSTNAAWRSAAVYSLGTQVSGETDPALFEKAIADPSPWVRAAGAAALAHRAKDRTILEQQVAPLLSDTNEHVATVAACALLEPEVQQASQLIAWVSYYRFENHWGGHTENMQTDNRPLSTLDGKPAFLESARKWLYGSNAVEVAPFALLLAQYGEFDGVDKLVSLRGNAKGPQDERDGPLLAAIALSHDPKYVPVLRQIAGTMQQEWDLRKILQALQGVTGPEARGLRLDINRRIREAGIISSGFRSVD